MGCHCLQNEFCVTGDVGTKLQPISWCRVQMNHDKVMANGSFQFNPCVKLESKEMGVWRGGLDRAGVRAGGEGGERRKN